MGIVFALESIETSWRESSLGDHVAELIEDDELKLEFERVDKRVDDGFECEVLCVVEGDDHDVTENGDHLDEDEECGCAADLLVE